MTALDLIGLTKTHPGAAAPVIQDLNLSIAPGQLTALLGPSGSGKTTVMKLIAGLLAPDAGDIWLDGQSITTLPPDKRSVVMVFQNALLFPHLTVAENVGFGLRMRGVPTAQAQSEVEAMLARVHLQDLGPRKPAQLSGGQAQRAALARALVLRPKVLLLDEPLSNLDASLRDDMRSLIRDLQRETGVTMLVVTHDQSEAVVLADRIALLLDGRLAQHAPPEALYRRPASEAVARFFGGVNFLDGQVDGDQFLCALGPLALPEAATPGPGRLTIRPEALRLASGPNQRTARVQSVGFLGTQSRVEVMLDGETLTALLPPAEAAALAPGDEITLSLPPASLWVLPG